MIWEILLWVSDGLSDKQNFGYGSTKSANEKKSAGYFHEEKEDRKIEKAVEESQTLLGKMTEENEKPLYEIHASAREYSGFFNFEETAAFEEKTTKKAFDKSVEQEPFEHKFIETPATQKKVSKKPLVFIALLLLIIGAGTLLYCNEDTRTKIQNSYHKAVQYFEDKGVSSFEQKEVLAISKKEFTVTEYQIIRKEGAIEERKPLETACIYVPIRKQRKIIR